MSTKKRLEHPKKIARTFTADISGYLYVARAWVPRMQPGNPSIDTGSITGFEGSSQSVDYFATKRAIHAFTKSLAQKVVDKRIRVNAADQPAPKAARHGAAFFTSSADSRYITGGVLTLLGGETTAS